MESEDMISLPATSNSEDCNENNELHKSELGPGEADPEHTNSEEESTRNVNSFQLNGGDIGTEGGLNDLENSGFNDNDMGPEEHATRSEVFEESEVVITSEQSNMGLQIMGHYKSDNQIEGASIQRNLGDKGIGAEAEPTEDQDALVLNQGDVRNEDSQFPVETEVDMDLVDSPVRQVNIEVADTVLVSDDLSSFGFRVSTQNDYLESEKESLIHNHVMNGGPVSGVKRARIACDEKQPSVHVVYNSLTRASKRKLEELLQQWSEWHAQNDSSSQDSNEMLESGEETYFPALWVGMEKSSAVSFWIENETKKQQTSVVVPPESVSVPLYDRGFSLGLTSTDASSNVEGGLQIVDEASRCFNCGSYSHSLKECSKPRDNVAVNHARKQHKARRNQSGGSRNATRYYQNSSGGKYDGLKPGALDAETRQALGLGELDPPPWLNRMRELGYPPGYLDPDVEDQPSGITIFADEDVEGKEEHEDGEILETEYPEPPRKMVVEFPGINAPIPENADERVWAADPYRNRSYRRSHHTSEPINRRHRYEQRGSRDSIDEGPPGVDSFPSSYPPRYGTSGSSYNFDSPRGSTPSHARSRSDRVRSPLVYEDFATRSSSLYSSQFSARLENEIDDRWSEYGKDYSYRSNDEYDRYEYDSHRR